jgi:hypothetical protein
MLPWLCPFAPAISIYISGRFQMIEDLTVMKFQKAESKIENGLMS